jgi:hypothetical protein
MNNEDSPPELITVYALSLSIWKRTGNLRKTRRERRQEHRYHHAARHRSFERAENHRMSGRATSWRSGHDTEQSLFDTRGLRLAMRPRYERYEGNYVDTTLLVTDVHPRMLALP